MSTPYLFVRNGPAAGALHPISGGAVTLGRGTAADLMLPDAAVSRMHAAIRVDGHTVVVEDLDSSNGTRVNGATVSQARLAHGDVIEVGATELEVRVEEDGASLPTPSEPTEIHPPR